MPAPQWNSFAGVVLLVLGLLVMLARASQSMLSEPPDEGRVDAGRDAATGTSAAEQANDGESTPHAESANGGEFADDRGRTPRTDRPPAERPPATRPDADRPVDGLPADRPHSIDESPDESLPHDGEVGGPPDRSTHDDPTTDTMTSGTLLLNVAVSQGLFGVVLVGAAWLANVPPAALGVEAVTLPTLGVGVALGLALFGANELGQRVADAAGIEYAEGLRELLTPDSAGGWAVLLLVVLPTIAGFEELLFRGALVGALAVGFDVSPWLLAAGSTVAFAVGHGAQGPGGILVTGILGGVLAAAFVLTGSLLVVVVAHYLVNALEFVVHASE